MWTTILTLDQFIETPMHHLFEGLVKSSIEILMLYMKFHKKWSAFARLTNDILNDVSSLNLNYCSTDLFNNEEDFKTGGWLAENYVAFSRIMLIILGHFEEYIEPNELGFYELQVMFQTLFALLSRLMSNKIFDNKTIDNYIKLFLGTCHYYEKDVGFEINRKGNKCCPFWYSKSNFVSLLNLTKQIELYGPVRLHWEGLKEKFIQKVKPLLKNKRTRVSYLVTKLQKMYRQNNLDVIIEKYVPSLSTTTYERICCFQRFKNLNNALSSIENLESLSGVVMKHNKNRIYIVHEHKDKIQLHRIVFDTRNRFIKSNLWYYTIDLKTKPNYIFTDYKLVLEETQDHVMIIPHKPGDKTVQNGYTVISKNWNVYSIEDGFYQYKPSMMFLERIVNKNK